MSGLVMTYDIYDDSLSMETQLPQEISCNSARYIGYDVIISAGGYTGASYIRATQRGVGFPMAAPGYAPATPVNFRVNHNGAQLRASLSWTNPSLTVSGSPLTDLDSVIIYRHDSLLHVMHNVQIGQRSNYDDNVWAPGIYTYWIFTCNDSGRSPGSSGGVWVGLDVPMAPSNVTATPGPNYELSCTLSWTAPSGGAHG